MESSEEKRIVNQVTKKVLKSLSIIDREPETMSPKTAQEMFGIKEATIRHLVRTKKIKGKPGKPFLVNVKSLRSFIEG